jgi:hypothetical protein
MLMQSLRAVGYTTPAALADLLDNSIAAGATRIEIDFAGGVSPFVATIDDGAGMEEDMLVSSMRFGSRDPRKASVATDLGRFGLGLKTASLSQCSRFTVLTLQSDVLSAARWDLEECERRNGWWLERPALETLSPRVLAKLKAQGRGTAVIWEELDRLGAGSSDPNRILDDVMNTAADHLALVFHRFLQGEFGTRLQISLNGRPLPVRDPFLVGHSRGQALHPETIMVDGWPVKVSPFVLPFPSRLKPDELDRVGGRETLKAGHGFYIYRGGRLVVPGGWFRIVPSDELMRLARVRVDVPTELDHLWKVDIRKTVAEPPPALRPYLRRIVGDVTGRSRRVYTHKGTPQQQAERVPLWCRHDGRDGAASWKVNRDHPAVKALTGGSKPDIDVERLLTMVEASLPAHEIHLHVSNDLPLAVVAKPDNAELEALAGRMIAAFSDQPGTVRALLEKLPVTDPFHLDPDGARRIAEKLAP